MSNIKLKTQVILNDIQLNKNLFKPIKNAHHIKPKGGLWSSTYTPDEKYVSEWHEFCGEEFNNKLTKYMSIFEFKNNTKVYQIDDYDDLACLYNQYSYRYKDYFDFLDYEKLSEKFDVINLTSRGQWETRLTNPYHLYGWDVECCLIMNFDCIGKITYQKL